MTKPELVPSFEHPDVKQLIEAFCRPVWEQRGPPIKKPQAFVHYTSASALRAIVTSNSFIARSVRGMNDSMEGLFLFDGGPQSIMGEIISFVREALGDFFMREYMSEMPRLRQHLGLNSYSFSLCATEQQLDPNGSIGMWRAYGGVSGAAIILKSDFAADIDGRILVMAPVIYVNHADLEQSFRSMANEVKNISGWSDLDPGFRMKLLDATLVYLALHVKNGGFFEEREWRISTNTTFFPGRPGAKLDVMEIGAIPQMVLRLNFGEGMQLPKYSSVAKAMEGVILGPGRHRDLVHHSAEVMLRHAGMENARDKISLSATSLY